MHLWACSSRLCSHSASAMRFKCRRPEPAGRNWPLSLSDGLVYHDYSAFREFVLLDVSRMICFCSSVSRNCRFAQLSHAVESRHKTVICMSKRNELTSCAPGEYCVTEVQIQVNGNTAKFDQEITECKTPVENCRVLFVCLFVFAELEPVCFSFCEVE